MMPVKHNYYFIFLIFNTYDQSSYLYDPEIVGPYASQILKNAGLCKIGSVCCLDI